MGSTYLNLVAKYTLILILAMFLKVLILDISPIGEETAIIVENKSIYTLKEVSVTYGESEFKKPEFENDFLDDYVDAYLDSNSCTYLDYSVFNIDDNIINLFLNCDSPKSIIYDIEKEEELSIDKIVKDYESFKEKVRMLISLKYPAFVADNVNFDTSSYDLKNNEIVGYFDSGEFGISPYRVNNNEIKNLMTYEMAYDDAYENEVYTLDKEKKTIAFTFDDGPSTYDISIIDALVQSHSTATFFVVGNRLKNYPTTVSKMIECNMEVGNHTYDHKSLVSLTNTSVLEEITKTNDVFFEMTGQSLNLLRPSYGAINKRVLLQVGMPVVLWNIDTLDWKTRDADKVYEAILSEAKDGDIVLMHSLYKTTLEAVQKVLPELYKRGFQVVSVSELAELKGTNLSAGSTISSIK